MWCVAALELIDTALYYAGGDDVCAAMAATKAVANAIALDVDRTGIVRLPFSPEQSIGEVAAAGGRARWATDPSRQQNLAQIRELWDQVPQGYKPQYRSRAAWARDMQDKFPELTDRTYIAWAKEWESKRK
jgi:hypothetical protein